MSGSMPLIPLQVFMAWTGKTFTVLVDGRLGSRLRGHHSLAPRPLTVSLLMSYIYGAPCKARNFNFVYIWTYVCQR
jgi:hypothetical protein